MAGGSFMDGEINVDFNRTDNAAEDLRLQTQQIKKWLAELDQELQHLKASWIGDDRDVYEEKQAAWNRAADAMGNLLTQYGGTLNEVSEAFRRNQSNAAQGFSNLRVGA
ncbi:WXG100 family type VII secretion target [Streptomyces sp. NPDC006990]|uniref:WXG100 family type VII secretion target n=1 Tax=unclassified Streptomyces TaxID=2593676 RepID=UPI0019F5C949|nr:WXG100 family type VII secretion target [Streptomyces sp. GKU 257-1]